MKNRDYQLKKTSCFLLFFLIMCCTSLNSVYAQQEQAVYAVVDFMKVKPENVSKYIELEKTVWKPVHQERIKQGEIVGWQLYSIRYTGTEDEYNYVTVTIFNDPSKLANTFNIDVQKVLPGKDLDKLYQETLESRELVKTRLFVRQSSIQESIPFNYIEVDFMHVRQGGDDEYVDVEENIWKPVHEELINSRTRAGWSLWHIVFPGGYGMDYQYVTVNEFSSFSQIGSGDYNAAFNKVHEGKNIDELMQRTLDSRVLAKSELWELLDSVFIEI